MARPRGRPLKKARTLGPYAHNGGYRFVTVGADGHKEPSETFPTEARAEEARLEVQKVIDGTSDLTVGEALRKYEAFLQEDGHRDQGGNKPKAVESTLYKIRCLLTDDGEMLEALRVRARCQALYDDLRSRRQPRELVRCQKAARSRGFTDQAWADHELGEPLCLCKPYAADSHRQMLLETKTFLRWCVEGNFIPESGMEGVMGKGKRREGKEQLRVDDGRRWVDQAFHDLNVKGDEQALACLCTVFMGLSGTEITDRLVEDVDNDCTILWITDGKTRNREKPVEIPEELRPYFRVLVTDRPAKATLWSKPHWRDWILRGVKRICREAGVKQVSGHAMRGLHGTMTVIGGIEEIQARATAALRHEPGSFATTTGPKYINPEALARTTQRVALSVLRGGRK